MKAIVHDAKYCSWHVLPTFIFSLSTVFLYASQTKIQSNHSASSPKFPARWICPYWWPKHPLHKRTVVSCQPFLKFNLFNRPTPNSRDKKIIRLSLFRHLIHNLSSSGDHKAALNTKLLFQFLQFFKFSRHSKELFPFSFFSLHYAFFCCWEPSFSFTNWHQDDIL